ncbi:MAG: diguanylate cyclase [bacterium]|nr:diguanylate cyclase [bacterium]
MDKIKILIVDDDKVDRLILKKELLNIDKTLECYDAGSAVSALKLIQEHIFDCIILDYHLPETNGFEVLFKFEEIAPVVMITGDKDDSLGLKAVKFGAQDFLPKENLHGIQLYRSICFAIERYRILNIQRELSFNDALTSIYNRRGFLYYADKRLKLSKRIKCLIVIMFFDIDKLKIINDTFGHKVGDQVILDTSIVLKNAFREVDIIGRLGGDEFAVLLTRNSSEYNEKDLFYRVNQNISDTNKSYTKGLKLSISMGAIECDSLNMNSSLEKLLEKADKIMYKNKRKKI